jgi:hypothetical protein
VCALARRGQVSSSLPFAALRAANVGGTRRVLEACGLYADGGKRVSFLHVSTLGFLPPAHPEALQVRYSTQSGGGGGSGGGSGGGRGEADPRAEAREEALRIAGLSGCAQANYQRRVHPLGVFPPAALKQPTALGSRI